MERKLRPPPATSGGAKRERWLRFCGVWREENEEAGRAILELV